MFLPYSEEEYYAEDRCATIPEAIREWAWNVGDHPDRINHQWLSTDYDSWTLNPHYVGPNQGHPEDAYGDEDEDMVALAADPAYQNWVESQSCYPDIPF